MNSSPGEGPTLSKDIILRMQLSQIDLYPGIQFTAWVDRGYRFKEDCPQSSPHGYSFYPVNHRSGDPSILTVTIGNIVNFLLSESQDIQLHHWDLWYICYYCYYLLTPYWSQMTSQCPKMQIIFSNLSQGMKLTSLTASPSLSYYYILNLCFPATITKKLLSWSLVLLTH